MAKKENIPDLGGLVEKAKNGDTEAFGQIYDALVKPLYRYVYYKVDAQIAEDITEETFLKVWQNLKKYKKGIQPFSAWVFRIAHNLVCDYYRKHEEQFEIDENVPETKRDMDPEKSADLKLNEVRLRKVIRKLPANYQEVIVLKYINDMDNDDIAKAIGKSEGAVRTLQFRALEQMRTMLKGKREDF